MNKVISAVLVSSLVMTPISAFADTENKVYSNTDLEDFDVNVNIYNNPKSDFKILGLKEAPIITLTEIENIGLTDTLKSFISIEGKPKYIQIPTPSISDGIHRIKIILGNSIFSDDRSYIEFNYKVIRKYRPRIEGANYKRIKQGYNFNPLDGVVAYDHDGEKLDIEVEGRVKTLEEGEYILTYTATDKLGLTSTVKRTIIVERDDKPTITGADDITIKVGDTFDPYDGVIFDDREDGYWINFGINGLDDLKIDQVGQYKLIYWAEDYSSQRTEVERVVTVRSNEKPVIHGADNITIKVGDTFNPLDGVTATDTEDGTISNIEVTGSVNTSEVGKYTLTYKVTDNDGNINTVERIVTVRSNSKPVIHGADNITIKVGDTFNPLNGVSATDTEDGTISNIEVTGSVNTSEVGEYTLTYKVTDNDGNITTVERIVIVKSNSKPITPPNTHPNIESTKPTEFEEIVGLNRFETATKISSKWNSAENVVITNAYSIVDSLSATPFASSKDAPILLSDKDNLTDITKNELKKLKTKNVYLIGGYSVLNDNIEKELKNIGINVVRIAGKTRFETSIEIAKYMTKDKKVSNIVIANGIRGLADAVTISPVASEKNMPIILSDIDKLPSGLDFIKEKNIDKTYIIGGTHNISENLSKEIDNITGDVVRVYGEDRDKTNIKVIETFYDTDKLNNIFVSKNGITKDIDLIDSLAVGSLASKEKSPILLVGNKLKEYQKNFIKKVKALKITKVGGNGNENAMNEIKDIVNSK